MTLAVIQEYKDTRGGGDLNWEEWPFQQPGHSPATSAELDSRLRLPPTDHIYTYSCGFSRVSSQSTGVPLPPRLFVNLAKAKAKAQAR